MTVGAPDGYCFLLFSNFYLLGFLSPEAAHLLLETLDRGLDATTPELEAATTERLVAAYGKRGTFPNQPGLFENTSTHNGFSL